MTIVKLPNDKEPILINISDSNLSWVAELGKPRKIFSTDEQIIKEALSNPIGASRLADMVDSQKEIVIIVDDIARPTPVAKLIPHIIQELIDSGAVKKHIKLVIAFGTHRVMTEDEIKIKYGIIDSEIEIVNLDYRKLDNYINIGTGTYGEVIQILKAVYQADLKIGVGNIVPHMYAGWGGGAKIIQPGVSAEVTTEFTHTLGVLKDNIFNLCTNPDNIVRKEMEAIAGIAGLDFIVNTVLDEHKEILNVFAGDFIKAHRAGVKFAEQVYRPLIPELADIVITTAYPSQIDYWQGIKGLIHGQFALKPGGVVIFTMAATEGLSGGNEIHTNTILEWAPQSEAAIRNGILQHKSADLVAMAFSLCHRQLLDRAKVICISTGLNRETLLKLGFIPATSMDEALAKAYEITGNEAKVGIVTYAGVVPFCQSSQ